MLKRLFFILCCLATLQAEAQIQEVIVGWDSTYFTYASTDNATYWRYPYANRGLSSNQWISTMHTFGGVSPSTASAGYPDGNQMIYNENPGTGWENGAGQKGWVFKFSTIGYENLTFSGKMAGSTSLPMFRGPRDFKLQYSLDSVSWTDVSGGTIVAGNAGAASYTLASISGVSLPVICANKPAVFLRMIMTSNASPDGFITTPAGNSIIDDFVVFGYSVPVAPTALNLTPQSVVIPVSGQAAPGTSFGTFTSVDANLGSTFSYSLQSGPGDTHNSLFSISGNSLVSTSPLNRGIYSVRVRSTDNSNLFLEKAISVYVLENRANIFSNPITGTSPGLSSPYTTGQVLASNISAGAIQRGPGLTGTSSNDRYGCSNWGINFDASKYFEFTIAPSASYGIVFEYADITIQHTSTSAKSFTLRSSADGYSSDIYTVTNTPTTATTFRFPLLHPSFQNVTSVITFRLYGYDATSSSSTASVNDFAFKGLVGSGCTPTFNTTNASACGSYLWSYNNQTYSASGTYTATGINGSGCTHTETLNLTITPLTSNTTNQSACSSYFWPVNGTNYTQSGNYSFTSGCHTEYLNLTITPSTSNTTTMSACDSYLWAVNNTNYTQSGNYSFTNGCHTEYLNLTITPSTSNTTTISACDSYLWAVNNTNYTQSGNYSFTNGCHTEYLNLTITPSSSNTTTISACDSYLWAVNNANYTQSGNYSFTNGCHTEYLNLTITPSTSNTSTMSACDSYLWAVNNTNYTQSGNYSFTNGCHTEYLNLTITPSTSNTTTIIACDSYLWAVNNMNYTQSGNYSFTNGCHTEILNLTINPLPLVTTSNVYGCPNSTVDLIGTPAGGSWSVSNPYTGPSTSFTYTFVDPVTGCSSNASGSITMSNAVVVTISSIVVNTPISATVNWNIIPGLLYYDVRYRPVGASSWTVGGTQAAPSNSKTLTGLDAGTTYEIEVRGVCNLTNPGPWGSNSIFTTLPPCGTPTILGTSPVTGTTAKLNWTAVSGATYYQIRYRIAGAPGWTSGGTMSAPFTSKTIIGLNLNTNYEWQIRAVCDIAPGPWTLPESFTTLPLKPSITEDEFINQEETILLYPNPTIDILNVDIASMQVASGRIEIVDMSGKVLQVVHMTLVEGVHTVQLNLGHLSAGLYQLKIFQDSRLRDVKKFNKSN